MYEVVSLTQLECQWQFEKENFQFLTIDSTVALLYQIPTKVELSKTATYFNIKLMNIWTELMN